MTMSGMTPLVSVIIPNYNYGRYLRETIESVQRQSYTNLEVIVIDDASTDDSGDLLRHYARRVRWFTQQRQGVSAARNRGVQESRGTLVAFLDADDCWLPTKLQRQVERWCREPELGLVHCGAEMIDDSGNPLQSRLDGSEGWVAKEMLRFRRSVIPFAGSTALVSRRVFDVVGGFDARLSTSADWDFCYRVATRHRIGFVPEALVRVRMHQTNMHANIRVMEHDMLLAYAKAFRDASPQMRRIVRRSYGNLHMVLAGCFFRAGKPVDFARHALNSLWLTPENCTHLLGFPLRWWTRQRLSMSVCRK
jgi:glycosyltransferase involved in cell wall biosynthesis